MNYSYLVNGHTEAVLDDWIALGRLMRAIQAAKGCDHWMALDLTMAQLKVALLVVQTSGVSSRGIAGRLNIGPSAVTPLVDSLVKLKLARREADPGDRRVVQIKPTAKLLELHGALLQSNRTSLADVLEEMSAADRETVKRSLALLRDRASRVLERTQKAVAVGK
jgi:DNA-binding MarR family transcriptional regulator